VTDFQWEMSLLLYILTTSSKVVTFTIRIHPSIPLFGQEPEVKMDRSDQMFPPESTTRRRKYIIWLILNSQSDQRAGIW
jgi:hypothetical protein